LRGILLGKTKEELKEIVAKLEDTDVVDQITDGIAFFKRHAQLMELAQLRLMIADAAADRAKLEENA
jgi:exonuclease VII small subunit